MNNPRRIQRRLVKVLATGALLAAAALPMAIATSAGAADAISGVTFQITGGSNAAYFGTGASGGFDVAGAFAGDGGNTTVTTSAPGVTFTGATNTSGTDIVGSFASTSATIPGTYSITVKDNAGTATLAGAFTVYGDPSVTSALTGSNASSISDVATPTSIPVTINGAGFVGDGIAGNPSVTFTSTVDGTSLTVGTATGGGAAETTPTSTLSVGVTPTNSINGDPATPGTYTVTVTNADGGSSTSGPIFTILGNEISTVSPSAVDNITGTTPLVISGGGFQTGATVAFDGACTDATLGTALVTSGGTITDSITITGTPTAEQCGLLVTNTGNNGASYDAVDAIGVGEGSSLPPTITASSLTAGTAIIAGAPSTTITLTGVGFSAYSSPTTSVYGTSNTPDAAAVIGTNCIANSSGTSLTCPIVVNTGTVAGPHTAVVLNNATVAASAGALPNAFTVDGPSITTAAPAAIAVGAPIGTVVVLTGTEFNNTTAGTVQAGSTLNGTFDYVSATTENFVVTTSPVIGDNGHTLTVHSTDAYGAVEYSAPFPLGVDLAPTVTSLTYGTGTTGVGVGATAQTVTINGTNFQTGATVSAFVNATGVADTAVTAKVTSVNNLGTVITATVAITSPDTNTIDGFTVTNPDGGNAKALAVAPGGLVIDAGPTVTAVSPTPVLASATNAITLTGTGFAAGAVVTGTTTNATCGVATVVSATSITVSCTFGVAQSTDTSLVVTNLDGGSATSAVVLPKATTKKPSTFKVTGVHGIAHIGKTSVLTITGTGFYGQPKITSSAAGTKATVTKDTGKVLSVRVTTPRTTKAGTKTLTIRLANGKSAKKAYSVKK